MANESNISDAAIVEEDVVVVDEEVRELFGLCPAAHEIEKIKINDPQRDSFALTATGVRQEDGADGRPAAAVADAAGAATEGAEQLGEPAWERLGSYIAGNDHLRRLDLDGCRLDDSKTAALFRGLTSSDTLREVLLGNNGFGSSGIRSMIPFLESSPNLTRLSFNDNGGIEAEDFYLVLQSLDGGAIESLNFGGCRINSGGCRINILTAMRGIRINLPKLRYLSLMSNGLSDIPAQALANCTQLETLSLSQNNIGESGFQAIANLLRKEDCRLTNLYVGSTGMRDVEAEMIADSLRCNKKLERLDVTGNEIGPEGLTAFLKLLNDVSSMDRTGNSNHTLRFLTFDKGDNVGDSGEEVTEIAKHIKDALAINRCNGSKPHATGRVKVLTTLLDRTKRMELSRSQGIEHSSDHYLFSGIDPILLPNALELAVESGSQSKLYQMLVVIAPDLVSLIDRKALKETVASNEARLAAIAALQDWLLLPRSKIA